MKINFEKSGKITSLKARQCNTDSTISIQIQGITHTTVDRNWAGENKVYKIEAKLGK